MVLAEDKLYTIPFTGDFCLLPLVERNLDGSSPKQIADDAIHLEVINHQLYYAAVEAPIWPKPRFQIRRYDSDTGVTEILTDWYEGYPREIYSDYVVFGDKVVYYD